jgi:outer membrane protein assembly factor BamA
LGKGDPFDTSLVNESVRNLRKLSYLLKTEIRLEKGGNGENIMVVNTSDKWTTVGGLSLHRSGGRTDIQLTLEENNLLGYGMFVSGDYWIVEKDRDFAQFELADNRFLGNDFSVNFFYSDNPRAGQTSYYIGRPFYNLRQKWGGGFRFSRLRKRIDYYIAEHLTAQQRSLSDKVQVKISYRIGPEHIKYHFTSEYGYSDLASLGQVVYDSTVVDRLPPPTKDSLINYIQFTFRLQQIKYVVFNRLNRFHKPEDINLGWDAWIAYGQALKAGLNGTIYHFFSIGPQYSSVVKSNLLIFGGQYRSWFIDHRTIHQYINLYFKGYRQYHNNFTLAVFFQYLSDRLSDHSYTIYLDEDNGLRGFPAYGLNGEDLMVINLENRFFSDLEILSVGVGGVAFADIGSIWSRERERPLEDVKTAFGVGLRFGVSRSTQGEVVRIDFAYAPKRKAWQISFGTGQFF